MEIAAVNSALSAVSSATPGTYVQAASMEMLNNTLELNDTLAQSTIKMIENSVTPYLGGSIDVSI